MPKLVKKAKTAKDLQKSRKIRKDFLARFGLDGKIPTSILRHDRKSTRRDKFIDLSIEKKGGNYSAHFKKNTKKLASSSDYTPGIDISTLKFQNRSNYLSAFPQNVGSILTDLYCPEGGTVYDPFMGHNSRMQMVFELGLNYHGVDICHEFMEDNKKIAKLLYKRRETSLKITKKDNWIQLHEISSDNVPLSNDSCDFTITSPPYWNLEYYGPEKEQLGNSTSYDYFLTLLEDHIVENYRVLRPGSFCIYNANDFRRNKKFYPFHLDLYMMMCDIGFEPFNIYILDQGNTTNQLFAQDVIKHRLLPKQHEFFLVMRVPGPDWWKNDKI